MTNLIGQTLLNQYRVDSFIASGGMGAVYRVTDLRRNASLAMKVLHADLADDPSIFKRFQREAQVLQQLKHPNIVPFYGLYQEQNTTFLLEAFIPGSSLQEILGKNRVLPLSEALTYMKGLCAALGYAHSQNIVHCDIKPGNVMVSIRGNIYLADFGIAKFIGATTTTTLGIVGTPSYMAPEQIIGRGITHLTDIYALGVVLFEMLVGQRPFRGTEPGTEAGGSTPSERIRYGHLRVPPPDPRQINSNISPALAQVVLRALAKNPAERFQSAQEFFNALCYAAQKQPQQISDETTFVGQYNEPPPISVLHTPDKPHPTRKQKRKNPALVFVFMLGAFIVLLILGLAMTGDGISTPVPDSSPPFTEIVSTTTFTSTTTAVPLTETATAMVVPLTETITETLVPPPTLTATPPPSTYDLAFVSDRNSPPGICRLLS
jgi:eukaryotic-like serine/threonine-protein kinase